MALRKRSEVAAAPAAEPRALPGQGELPAAQERDLRTIAPVEPHPALEQPEPMPVDAFDAGVLDISPLRADFERIIETVFVEDTTEMYPQLERDLLVGQERSDRGVLEAALDNAESNARKAHRLWISAEFEAKRWELDNGVVFAAMWNEAERSLQRQKEGKERNKSITNDDVKHQCLVLFPDEYTAQELKKERVKLMVKSMANLAAEWDSKCRSLQTMLGKQR